MGRKWTEEQEEEMLKLRNEGLSSSEIGTLLNRTEASIKLRCSKLIKAGRILTQGNGKYNILSDEHLLELVKKYRSAGAWESDRSINNKLPSVNIVLRRFGSWNNALDLAGLTISYGLDKDKITSLYLVYFIDEEFYKIGISQATSINIRFRGYPKYTIIDIIKFQNLQLAKLAEKKLLHLVKCDKYIPNCFGSYGGHHECFKPLIKFNSLSDITSYYSSI